MCSGSQRAQLSRPQPGHERLCSNNCLGCSKHKLTTGTTMHCLLRRNRRPDRQYRHHSSPAVDNSHHEPSSAEKNTARDRGSPGPSCTRTRWAVSPGLPIHGGGLRAGRHTRRHYDGESPATPSTTGPSSGNRRRPATPTSRSGPRCCCKQSRNGNGGKPTTTPPYSWPAIHRTTFRQPTIEQHEEQGQWSNFP